MKRRFIFGIILILLCGTASASFLVGDGSFIEVSYNGAEKVKGILNISFSEQNGNSLFTSNFNGSKTLYGVLNSSGYKSKTDFSCDPLDCGKRYTLQSITGSSVEQFDLSQKNYFGFRIDGENIKLNSANYNFDFNVTSNVDKSCTNQVYVDFFDDGKIDFYNAKFVDVACGAKIKGCYSGQSVGSVDVDSGFLCEKVTLPPAPAFRAGANLNVESGVTGKLYVYLLKVNSSSNAPYLCGAHEKSSGAIINPNSGESSAVILCAVTNYTDAYVCVSAGEYGGTGKFKVGVERNEDSCGGRYVQAGQSAYISENGFDYDLFAQPLQYDKINSNSFAEVFKDNNQAELKNSVDAYINASYGRNCTNGCVIPFSVWASNSSGLNTNYAILNGARISYESSAGVFSNNNLFYSVFPTDFVISSPYRLINLEKIGFQTPEINGTRLFKIFLDGKEVLKENINVKIGFKFDIFPKFSLIGRETEYSVSGISNGVSSKWDFGDGSALLSTASVSATHVYTKNGIYNVQVEARNSLGESSVRNFKIIVGDPKISLRVLIDDYSERISRLKEDVTQFPDWTKSAISQNLQIENKEEKIKEINNRYSALTSSANESSYGALINEISAINLPERIFVSQRATSLPGELGFGSLDPSLLETLEEKQSEDLDATKNAIISWMNENYKFDLSYNIVSARSGSEEGALLTGYKISAYPKKAQDDTIYLFIKYPADKIIFKPGDEFRAIGNDSGVYKTLSGNGNSFEFLILGAEAPNPENLGIYISPSISDLEIQTTKPYVGAEDTSFPWARFIVALVVMLFFLLVIYILLYWWYKTRYEGYLFKSSADLYNIINFIYNSRKAGLRDEEIRKKLLSNKWTNEQIRYSFKKIDGKRTGLWEIPIFKVFENKKVKEEIEKRQGVPVDARFIKRHFQQ